MFGLREYERFLARDSFAKLPKGFWPAIVSRNPRGENVLACENTNNRDPEENKMNKTKIPLYVGACFSSRFTPQLLSLNFIFCDFVCGGFKGFCIEGKFWVLFILLRRKVFGFLQWVVKGSFGSLGDRNF